MKNKFELLFTTLGLLSLIGGMFFGVIASLQFVYPGFLESIPFYKTRPLHVSLIVAWIFLSSIGGIYYYLPNYNNIKLHSRFLGILHFSIFLFTGILILICYFLGEFGGREYWEFPPILAIPIFVSWIIFGWNYFKTAFKTASNWPVYMWMWATGIFFFLFTFSEAYLWLLPQFKGNVIKELTLQWKAYGALVGSWNMLVYGTAIFLMEKIKKNSHIGRSKIAFLMYFLGLINLMFGWAHHIYNVPTAMWIRYLAYLVSMSELIILAKIIYNWKKSLTESVKDFNILPYKFLVASDIWILLNLILALLLSVPAINMYTHGTHITVAHAMGSTIGINTMILLASCLFLIDKITKIEYTSSEIKTIKYGYTFLNIFLLIFWVSLIIAGTIKGQDVINNQLSFQEIMTKINPILIVFSISGIGVFLSILAITIYPIKKSLIFLFNK
ncbi:MAG: cbb3-type cytochrome c oxidase subunit I [Bacteroidetes bacterium]|nr:cbb3-type cytochrome c oxidase subunit I [Bacteroidota bacterium]